MPRIVHEFAWPDRLVVGTIGHPGSRTFYLQARSGARLVSVALEKEQSAVLAEKIAEILDQLASGPAGSFSVPSTTPLELIDNEPLEQPVEQQFRTGAMTLGWDPSTAQIVIEAYPLTEDDDPSDDAEEVLLVRIPVGAARAFAERTLEIVGAGRPLCPLCGSPLDPEGHDCPALGDE